MSGHQPSQFYISSRTCMGGINGSSYWIASNWCVALVFFTIHYALPTIH